MTDARAGDVSAWVDACASFWAALPLVSSHERVYIVNLAVSAGLVVSLLAVQAHQHGGLSYRALATSWSRVMGLRICWHPSARMDYLSVLLRSGLRVAWTPVWWLTGLGMTVIWVGQLDGLLGDHGLLQAPAWLITLAYTFVLFIAWDASRFALHYAMHRVPQLWAFHQVHHSAQVMTPLTLHRIHPLESGLQALRGVLVTAIVAGGFFWVFRQPALQVELLGVNCIGAVANWAGANLRHSHVWLSFGRAIETHWLSPAQHQMHHARESASSMVNYGSFLAIWDRWLGSHRYAAEQVAALEFGLDEDQLNHDPRNFVSMLVNPFMALGPRWRRNSSLIGSSVLLAWLPAQAWAQPPTEPDQDESAHTVDDSGEDEVFEISLEDLDAQDPTVGVDANSDTTGGPATDPASPQQSGVSSSSSQPAPDLVTETVAVVGDQASSVPAARPTETISAEALERAANDDIHRVLRQVPGVQIREEDGHGLRPNIGIRGVASDRSAKVTLLEDGILLAPAPYSAPAAYYFPLMRRIVGVEIFKGPSALRIGPNTTGGGLDLQTRDIPAQPRIVLQMAGGSHGQWSNHLFMGTSGARGGVAIEVAQVQSDGFKHLPSGADTGFQRFDATVESRVHNDPARRVFHEWSAKLGVGRERSQETYLGLSEADFVADPYQRYAASQLGDMQWWRWNGRMRWFVAAGTDFESELSAYRNDFDRSWRKLDSFRQGPSVADILAHPDAGRAAVYHAVLRGERDGDGRDQHLMVGTNRRRYVSQGLNWRARWRPIWGPLRQSIELGVRLHHDQIARDHRHQAFQMQAGQMLEIAGEANEVSTANRGRARALALHLHDDIEWRRWTLSPSLRLELVGSQFVDDLQPVTPPPRRFDAMFTPGVGLRLTTVPGLDVFAGIRSGASSVAPGQSASARPERSTNYELGLAWLGGGLRAELVGFYNHIEDLATQCTLASGCAGMGVQESQLSGGVVDILGAELHAGYRREFAARWWWALDLTATLTRSRFAEAFTSTFPQYGEVLAGDELPYVPNSSGRLAFSLGHDRWQWTSSATYVGSMRDRAGQGELVDGEHMPAHLLIDLTTQLRVHRYVQAFVRIDNLTNRKYVASRRPFGARPGRPLSAMLGVKIDWELQP